MGTVYRATHLLIERPVAVKVLSPRLVTDDAAKERFRREARAAGRLQHSNAVAVTDFGETREGLVYLVMELLEGKPLREVLAREAPLDPARAVSLMLQISAAVEAAHEAGIIHRDLKPGNIFLVQRPDSPYIVKVLDFGIAKLAADDGEFNVADTLDGHRRHDRHAALHVARAVRRRAAHARVGRLQPGRHPLRDADGADALLRRLAARARAQALVGASAAAARAGGNDPARARSGRASCA